MNADDDDLASSILLLEEIQATLLTLSRQRALNRERRPNGVRAFKGALILVVATPVIILTVTFFVLFGAALLAMQ